MSLNLTIFIPVLLEKWQRTGFGDGYLCNSVKAQLLNFSVFFHFMFVKKTSLHLNINSINNVNIPNRKCETLYIIIFLLQPTDADILIHDLPLQQPYLKTSTYMLNNMPCKLINNLVCNVMFFSWVQVFYNQLRRVCSFYKYYCLWQLRFYLQYLWHTLFIKLYLLKHLSLCFITYNNKIILISIL